MKLILTALIDFNNFQKSDQNASERFNANSEVIRLIHPNTLLDDIADTNGGVRPNVNDYYKNVFPATLKFSNLAFRQRYLKWIYSNYSQSMVNQRRVRWIERDVIINWAKQFNQHHSHLKIVKLATKITDASLNTKLWIIGYGRRLDHNSFDFQNALGLEYHQDYYLSFYNLESDESRQLAESFNKTFRMYLPSIDFHFYNQAPSYKMVNDVQPLQFNRHWLEHYQKQSASALENKLSKAHLAYSSAASKASLFADRNSQVTLSLNDRVSSMLNDYSEVNSQLTNHKSLNSSLTAVNTNLGASIKSLSSVKSSYSQVISAYKQSHDSLSNRVKGLSEAYQSTVSASASVSHNRSEMAIQSLSQSKINDRLKSQVTSLNNTLTVTSNNNPQVKSLKARMLNRESSYAQDSEMVANQMNSLKESHSKLVSIFDYNQSVYRQQISDLTSSAAAVKMIKWPSSVATPTDRESKDIRKTNKSLTDQNTRLKYQLKALTDDDPSFDGHVKSRVNLKDVKASRKAEYIPIIIAFSIIIIFLLIFVFPFFRF